jgi:membrane protein implicated in regulation of membrane protease activity
MDSAAGRVERVLIGFAVPLYLLTALSLAEGRIALLSDSSPNEDSWALVFGSLAVLSTLLYAYIRYLGSRSHGSSPLDKVFSRESEEEMLVRLREEQGEADVSSMGSAWAEMEKDHLERTLGEEE